MPGPLSFERSTLRGYREFSSCLVACIVASSAIVILSLSPNRSPETLLPARRCVARELALRAKGAGCRFLPFSENRGVIYLHLCWENRAPHPHELLTPELLRALRAIWRMLRGQVVKRVGGPARARFPKRSPNPFTHGHTLSFSQTLDVRHFPIGKQHLKALTHRVSVASS